jgi:hypothetical protein
LLRARRWGWVRLLRAWRGGWVAALLMRFLRVACVLQLGRVSTVIRGVRIVCTGGVYAAEERGVRDGRGPDTGVAAGVRYHSADDEGYEPAED